MNKTALLLTALVLSTGAGVSARAQSAAPPLELGAACNPATLTADFAERDKRPESTLPRREWYDRDWNRGWGPFAATYPEVRVPAGCDPATWKRDRIVAVARKYIGLSYRHHHIPDWDPSEKITSKANAEKGLDCSNFTSWVYNYGLGKKFTSDITDQAEGKDAPGRKLAPNEPLKPGDLMYILLEDRSKVSHVVIYVDENHIIDSHGKNGGVKEHAPVGWYKTHFAFARRIIE